MPGSEPRQQSIDQLLDRASAALQQGDLRMARELASEALAAESANVDAGDLLTASLTMGGELRRLTILFCDLVESTALSGRLDLEIYRGIVGRYKSICRRVIEDRYGGHIAQVKGDGILAVFGMTTVREDDANRAVRACLDVMGELRLFSSETERVIGEQVSARAAVHHGLVFADETEDEIYGLAANVAARLESLAEPGTVVVSKEVLRLVERLFVIEPMTAQYVKGVEDPVQPYVVRRALSSHARPRPVSPFVGRDRELAELVSVWDGRAERSRPAVVQISGEAGMGKSRLSAALADRVRADGFSVVELFGSPLHRDVGLHPVRELLELHCGSPEGSAADLLLSLHDRVRALKLPEAATSLLAPVLGLTPDAGYQPAEADARKLGEEVAGAAFEYLEACVRDQPTLLTVEDLHWVDEGTRGVLQRLISTGPPTLMVVMTSRAGGPTIGGLQAQSIELGPLPPDAQLALVDQLAASTLSSEQRRQLVARADGVPLFLTELARAALDVPTGASSSASNVAEAAGAGQKGVPDVLYEPLEARLSARPGLAPVASAAAALGREVTTGLLAEVADLEPVAADAALASLADEGILEPWGATTSGVFRFRHELLRQVAYEILPNSARRRVHARIADALRRRAVDDGLADWPVLASHCELAGRYGEAITSWDEAAQAAGRRGALTEARTHFTRALDLVPKLPEAGARRSEIRLRIYRGLLGVTMEGFSSETAAVDFERALQLALDGAVTDEVHAALMAIWTYHASRSEFDRSRRVLEILRDLRRRQPWFQALNEAAFGVEDWFGGRFREARHHLKAGVAGFAGQRAVKQFMSGWLFPNDGALSMRAHLATALMMAGDPRAALDEVDSSLRTTERLPFPQGPFSRAYVRAYEFWIRFEQGDEAGARGAVEDTAALAEAHGFDFFSVVAITQTAVLDGCNLRASDDKAGVLHQAGILAGCLTAFQMTGTSVFLPFYLTQLAVLLGAAGELDAAAERASEALILARKRGDRFYEAETLRVQAALAPPEDGGRRQRELLAAWRVAHRQGAVPLALRIALDLVAPDHGAPRPAAWSKLRDAVDAFAPGAFYPELEGARALLAAGQ